MTSTATPGPVEVSDHEPQDSLRSIELDVPSSPRRAKSKLDERRAHLKRLIGTTTVLAGILVVLVAYAFRTQLRGTALGKESWRAIARLVHAAAPAPAPRKVEVAAAPAKPAAPRADAHVNRSLIGHIPGGVVFIPSTFSSEDGAYDLLLHFHGNTKVVAESAEYAHLNAIVAVVNLGINSAPYLDAYATPGTYEQLLEDVTRAVTERGLEHAHLRRLALSSWSGGYGAISMILEVRKGHDPLDVIAVEDGIHCGFLGDDPKAPKVLNSRILIPFLGAAKKAAAGEFLFTITHSNIDPVAYAGTSVTAQYLLDQVGGHRGPPASPPEHVELKAAEGAVSKKLEKFMEPESEATVGSFHVRGYVGNTPEHHMAHLLQMGATVLPEIAARWGRSPD